MDKNIKTDRKILVEVTKQELKILEKGFPTKESILNDLTDLELITEIRKRGKFVEKRRENGNYEMYFRTEIDDGYIDITYVTYVTKEGK